jgi:hypothetical protein
MKIASVADADTAKPDLEKVVKAWCDWRDGRKAAPKVKAKKAAPKAKAKAKPKPKAKARAKRR